MADNLGPMAWLFLPENVLPQWQQKIALRAENPSGPKQFNYMDCFIFRTKCDFLQVLDLHIFRIERRAIEAHVSNPFSPNFFLYRRI